MQWNVFLAVLLVLTTGAIGLGVDRIPHLTAVPLFAALTLASLLGTMLAGVYVWRLADRPWKVLYLVCGLYLSWRLCYFPWLAVSGMGAAYVEWLLVAASQLRPWIYATLLPLFALLHLGAALAVGLLLVKRRGWLALLGWPVLLLAAALSLSGRCDLHPLPDRCLWSLRAPVAPALPVANPYQAALERGDCPPGQRLLVAAAGTCYRLVPVSPWSSTVQGTLESLFRDRRQQGTADYLEAHYLALRAAHRFVGHRDVQVRRPHSPPHVATAEGRGLPGANIRFLIR